MKTKDISKDIDPGRGASIYMVGLLVLNFAAISWLFLSGPDAMQALARESALLEICVGIFVLELMVYVIWSGVISLGWGRMMLLVVVTFVVTFLAEASGVNFGWVFGHYYYSDMLGFKVWGVPLLVALAWEPIIFASYRMAKFLLPAELEESGSTAKKVVSWICLALIGALATTHWDMMLDPFAVKQGWWVWPGGGPYVPYLDNGVPISNFVGWFKVAFVCQLFIHFIYTRGPKPRQSVHLNVYGPLMLYFLLFMNSITITVIFLERLDICMIGVMGMGTLTFIFAAKAFLLKQGFEQSPGVKWLQKGR